MEEKSLSLTEENYLKAIYHLTDTAGAEEASTNAIAQTLQTKAGSVSEMLKKLAERDYLVHRPYRGVVLTENGKQQALKVVRRHRLWETFLSETLGFPWDRVHDLAEELEHIRSEELIARLDKFLGYPSFDPHGDPIPNHAGVLQDVQQTPLSELKIGETGIMTGVADHNTGFLQLIEKRGFSMGCKINLQERVEYDGSVKVATSEQADIYVSETIAQNILVKIIY